MSDPLSQRCHEITKEASARTAKKIIEAATGHLPAEVRRFHWRDGVSFALIDNGEVQISAPSKDSGLGYDVARIPAREWQSIVDFIRGDDFAKAVERAANHLELLARMEEASGRPEGQGNAALHRKIAAGLLDKGFPA